jgi:uncharacterized protein (TIGR03067 family)
MLLFAAPVLAEDEKFDGGKMIGDWSYTSGKRAGETIDKDRLMGTVSITKETITMPAGPDEKFVIAYKLDASKNPVTIDLDIKSGPVGEGKAVGIIRFDGEKLVLCYDPTGAKRPEKFESTEANGAFMFTLARNKKDEKK